MKAGVSPHRVYEHAVNALDFATVLVQESQSSLKLLSSLCESLML